MYAYVRPSLLILSCVIKLGPDFLALNSAVLYLTSQCLLEYSWAVYLWANCFAGLCITSCVVFGY